MGLFKSKSERTIKKLNNTVQQILDLEDRVSKYTDVELKNMTASLKKELEDGKTLDDILPIAFAVCREASWRVLKMKHFPVQIIGGIILHQGRIAEMCTGEGKTLVATLPTYLNALTGKGVHVVTVNDYLARRDSEQMGKIFRFLGLTVGTVLQTTPPLEKKKAYACDVTYCTNVELGFDYLRDNMAVTPEARMQRGFNFCIIDEIDSILIDEARTPLIISGPGEVASEKYKYADEFVRTLKMKKIANSESQRVKDDETIEDDCDYIVDEKAKTATLTASGIAKAEKFFEIENYSDENNSELNHYVSQALKAHGVMKKDVDYIIRKDGKAIDIVDEFTGRVLEGRRFSEGLHQAIETKEGVSVERESKTLATITYQNFFRLYPKLSGMTGTAMTEEAEFMGIYGIDVVTIPTNMPIARNDEKDALYRTEKSKFAAVVEEIKNAYEIKQPVLVGTTTVEKSEMLSKMLKKEHIPHNVLNAKHHEQEARIIAQAGTLGSVTISTNMAGRGTDIMLGGNPTYLTREEMLNMGYTEEEVALSETITETDDQAVLDLRKIFNEIYAEKKKITDEQKKDVLEMGGLYVIGTERHESRRIDNQLRGRSGRQGDVGKSKFYISFEDDLLRLFGGEKIQDMLEATDTTGDVLMEGKMITNLVESAQKKVEGNHYAIRKNVLEFDEVIDGQRKLVYEERNRAIEMDDVSDIVTGMIEKTVEKKVTECINEAEEVEEWDLDTLNKEYCETLQIEPLTVEKCKKLTVDEIHEMFIDKARENYNFKKNILGDVFKVIQKTILLQSIDICWMDHVDDMAELRKGIGLRGYAQKNPVLEYKMEGYEMFEDMTYKIKEEVTKKILELRIVRRIEKVEARENE